MDVSVFAKRMPAWIKDKEALWLKRYWSKPFLEPSNNVDDRAFAGRIHVREREIRKNISHLNIICSFSIHGNYLKHAVAIDLPALHFYIDHAG